MTNTEFDAYAANYDDALTQGLSVSGESKEYFAKGRVDWLERCLNELGERPSKLMDYGCGTGSGTPFLLEASGVESLLGIDFSLQSLAVARRHYGSERVIFLHFDHYEPCGQIDLVFCNGVFHHIPPSDRANAIDYIYRSLRPGAMFAFWENNPLNPGTRYVMSRIPFDRDAVVLTAREARRLLVDGGFEVLRTDFMFIFPRALRLLRRIEPVLSRFPLGAQYQILCRKP